MSTDETSSRINLAGKLQCSPMYVGTHDVDSITVSSTFGPNAVELSATYVDNSPALGALFMLLFNDADGTVDYTQSVYLVLDRNTSSGFLQDNVTEGYYTVLAFDVEGDGGIPLGEHSPAAVASVDVSGEGTYMWSMNTM